MRWSCCGTSFAYAAFVGVSQLVCAAFLCFRRTQLVGAIGLLPIIGNIVFVNFAYDIPVKFFSCFFLAMTVYLVLSDARRLKAFFWDHAFATPSPQRVPVVRSTRVRRAVKTDTRRQRAIMLNLENGLTFEGRYRDLSGERLRLAGRVDGDSLTMRLRRTNE